MNIGEAIKTLFYRKNKKIKNRLTTSYGEKIDPEHVLDEYPRPQLFFPVFVASTMSFVFCNLS